MRSRWSSLGVLWAMWRHRLDRRADVQILRGRSIRLEAAGDGEPPPLQVDGDPAGEIPVEISVLPAAQGFLVPAGSARGAGGAR